MREVMEKSISHMRNPKLIIDAVLQGLEEAGYVIVPLASIPADAYKKETSVWLAGVYDQLNSEQKKRARNVDLHPSVSVEPDKATDDA